MFFSRAAGISGVGRRPTRLRYKYPFALRWEKRTFHCEKHISDKTSITNDIPQSCIFLLFISCLLHMLSLTFLFFIIHFYFSMQFLWAWISHGTEPVGVTFSQYSPASKKEPADSRPNFYSWANGAFFCQHTKDQCVILKQTHFVVATLNTLSDKSNVNF